MVKSRYMNKKKIIGLLIVVVIIAIFSYPRGTGYIKVETPGSTLSLRGGLFRRVKVGPSTEPKEVRAGGYRPIDVNYFKEINGNKWQLYGSWRNQPEIQVIKGQTVSLKFGPPFVVQTDMRRRGRNVSLGLSLVGQAGERYNLSMYKNGKWSRPSSPKVKIVDEAGNVLVHGQFEYG